jgi:hypothetical protein
VATEKTCGDDLDVLNSKVHKLKHSDEGEL